MTYTVYWDSDAFLRVINGEEDRAFIMLNAFYVSFEAMKYRLKNIGILD